MKKSISLILVSILIVATLAGCTKEEKKEVDSKQTVVKKETEKKEEAKNETKKEQEPIRIEYMTSETALPKNQNLLNEALQKDYPYLTVEYKHVGDNYPTVLKTRFASGDAPELFNWTGYYSNQAFVEAGFMLDITEDKIHEGVQDQFVASGMWDGKVYGIPTVVQGSGLIYNKTLFEKAGIDQAPKTIPELKEAIVKLNDAGIQPFAAPFKNGWACHQMFWNVLGPNVGDFQTWHEDMNAGKASFKNDKVDKTFELIDLVVENSGDRPLESDFGNLCRSIGAGDAAMAFQGVWAFQEIEKMDPEVKVGMAPIPVSDNPEDATLQAEAQAIIFVSAATDHKEAAKDYLRWVTTKAGAEATNNLSAQGSPMKSNPEIKLNPLSQDSADYINAGGKTVGFVKTYWPAGLQSLIGKELQNYIGGVIDREQFYNNIDKEWAKLVSEK